MRNKIVSFGSLWDRLASALMKSRLGMRNEGDAQKAQERSSLERSAAKTFLLLERVVKFTKGQLQETIPG
jgi:hypothetical protein